MHKSAVKKFNRNFKNQINKDRQNKNDISDIKEIYTRCFH